MPQDAEGQAPLSVHHAFVVHFRTSTDIAQGRSQDAWNMWSRTGPPILLR